MWENKGRKVKKWKNHSCILSTFANGKLVIEPTLDFLSVGDRSGTVIREPHSLA